MGIADDVVGSGDSESDGSIRPRRSLLPSEDPFYVPPVDFPYHPPGTVLRTRKIRIALFGVVRQKVNAWQLLYRSSDLHGEPETAVTTVLLPHGADPNQPRPLLAFQCAIDAVAERCFPSYALRSGARALGSIPQFEWFVVSNALTRGWAVSIADHEGMDGAFGAPREPGYRVLDGIRAALAFGRLNLSDQTPIALWGYSGGGMASSWAAEMAPMYSPELNIVGAALGAPVGDPEQAFLRLSGKTFAGLALMVIAGLETHYPALETVLTKQLSPKGRRYVDRAASMTTVGIVLRFARRRAENYVTDPLEEVLSAPAMRAMFDDLRLGTNIPDCPLLVVQPVHDQIIHVDDVDGQVGRYLRGGARVTYRRDRLSEHGSLMVFSAPMVLEWLSARIAGAPVEDSNTETVWTVITAPPGRRGSTAMIATVLRVLLGRPLRPRKNREALGNSTIRDEAA